MRKHLAPLMFVVAAAAPLAIAHAHGGGDFGPHHGDMMLQHMLDTVDATDAQRTQIEAIEARYRPQMKSLRQQIHENHATEMGLDTSASGYLDQANTLIDQRTALTSKAEKLHAQIRQEIEGVLSTDQRAKLRTEVTNFHSRHHHAESNE